MTLPSSPSCMTSPVPRHFAWRPYPPSSMTSLKQDTEPWWPSYTYRHLLNTTTSSFINVRYYLNIVIIIWKYSLSFEVIRYYSKICVLIWKCLLVFKNIRNYLRMFVIISKYPLLFGIVRYYYNYYYWLNHLFFGNVCYYEPLVDYFRMFVQITRLSDVIWLQLILLPAVVIFTHKFWEQTSVQLCSRWVSTVNF